ncbi:CBS domain-containing protein [Nocardioides bizhenqiangii]|uniref:CBS domain-containing protein n=1 Tax=Nocardioides bizhenqiangii TaxID=3095076 RepID=A0ABZ0ZSK5_9ACTN|nr:MULTISPECIES: CBS domain-containing protein [unclassified Nocardioides]MDZ5619202.1 CBS domain-containing protein [Nocardioides sp. HM23]WQQ26774.1 CBS domain-containing protein [Nocardioides sp. HM61]
MRARDLAAPYPTVHADAPAVDAARILTEAGRPALVVVDDHDHPTAILPASQVLRFVIPRYIQDDPALARVVDEEFADHMCDSLAGKTVAELLPREGPKLVVVEPDDNVIEIAALMAGNRSPLVAVVDGKGSKAPMMGAITVASLLSGLLPERITDPG